MEGFVKVLKKNDLNVLKRYFFYLTYNNRAHIVHKFNPPLTNELDKVEELKKNKLVNNKDTLRLNNPYNSYVSYRNEIKNEWKQNKTKALEIIFSYSKKLNQLMSVGLGEDKWEEIYREIISSILNKHFENNRHILQYFHKHDSTGYRYHCHTLLYPFENNTNGMSIVYNHIEPEKLKIIKNDFNNEIEKVIDKYKALIKQNIVEKLKRKIPSALTLENEEFFNIFLEKNKDIDKYFNKNTPKIY